MVDRVRGVGRWVLAVGFLVSNLAKEELKKWRQNHVVKMETSDLDE